MSLAKHCDERPEPEAGFTLIELLVVTVVIATLAAIAIPTYLSQTQRAFDSQMKSSLHSLATSEESYLSSQARYGTIAELLGDGASIARAADVTLKVVHYNGSRGYCLVATHAHATSSWYWDSEAGGLQPDHASGCPIATTGPVGDSLP